MLASVAEAAVDPFYVSLYSRGIAHYNAGEYDLAARELRLAAFGFVDAVEQFETAHIYAALAASNRKQEKDARSSVQRILAAERVRRTYPSLVIPAAVREQFETLAKAYLNPTELAMLHAPVAAPTTTPPKPATLADADRAIAAGDLDRARAILVAQLEATEIPRPSLLKIAAGLYQTRGFADAARAFERLGTLGKGEEGYHYYYAVALFETRNYAAAKRELAAALPFIEMTADVQKYRDRINNAPAGSP